MNVNRKNFPFISKSPRWGTWVLVLLVFSCHGMLLLNDGVYWDGWQLYGYYLNHDVESLLGVFSDAGALLIGYFHLMFWSAPSFILAYKLVSFLSILLSTLLVYSIVQRISIISTRERWFIAAIYCCYPAFQTQIELITTPALFMYFLFWLGIFTAIRCFEKRGRTAYVLRIIALIFIAIGFGYNSLLVLYFPLLILFLMGRQHEWLGMGIRGKLLKLSRYGDFILLPFGYWIIFHLLSKPKNEYAEYNQLIFAPKQWAIDFGQSINNAVFAQFHNLQTLVVNHLLLGASIVIFGVLAEKYFATSRSKKESQGVIEISEISNDVAALTKIVLIALALLVCAIFPYVAVGKFPLAEGWTTRHALLISLPVAIGLVAAGRSLHFILLPNFVPHILKLSAALLVLAFTLVSCKTYLEWQVRWIKDSSFIYNLRQLPKERIKGVTIFIANDAYPVGNEFYRYTEYAAMFKMAWGDESRIAFHPAVLRDSEWVLKNAPLQRNLLKDFRTGGCQGMLTIRSKHPELSRIHLVKTYLMHRWLTPTEMPAFLGDVTTLELTDISCPSLNTSVLNQ